ncbi:hypothetical protein AVEN_163597-1 [Araneus ventricosus]|uniref:Uncharacterized protein n=1 Tax=Araneus ventricosus TaxID=182803 RepID=A0A4Y2WCS4_ARAVE|nr:hypothetical protein AVEN_163597-1 [Araneus ventricosus]
MATLKRGSKGKFLCKVAKFKEIYLTIKYTAFFKSVVATSRGVSTSIRPPEESRQKGYQTSREFASTFLGIMEPPDRSRLGLSNLRGRDRLSNLQRRPGCRPPEDRV